MIPFPASFFARSQKAPAPAVALEFDYVAGTYRLGGVSYPSLASVAGLVFERGGEQGAVRADGTVGWFAPNVPALNDRGLHLYGAVTAYSPNAQALQNWSSYSGPTVSGVDSFVAPDGTMSAERVTFTNESFGQLFQSIAGPAGAATLSVFGQADGTPKSFRLKAFAPSDNYSPDFVPSAAWQRFVHRRTAPSGTHGQLSIGNTSTGGIGSVRLWQAQLIGGDFADGGPLVRTGTAPVTLPASALRVPVPNGTYVATYRFDDGSEQSVPTDIGDGQFRHAALGTLQRAIVTSVRLAPA